MNPRRNRIKILAVSAVIVFSGVCLSIQGQDRTFRIYGEIQVPRTEGTVFIHIVDREYFDVPLSGLDTIILKVNSSRLEYEFLDIPTGIYGIKCFQDLNGNGKLDRGLFGPSEPWALSWKGKKRFPPRYEDISFSLTMEKQLNMQLKK